MRTEELIRLDREELEHMAKMACSSDIYYELADSISEFTEDGKMISFNWNKHKQKIKIPIQKTNTNMYEKDFVDAFLNDGAVRRIFSDKYFVMREFESTSGTPDVLLVNRRHAARLVDFTSHYSGIKLGQAHARVILSLNKRFYSNAKQIQQQTGYSLSYVRLILDMLSDSGIIQSGDNGWKLVSSFKFPKVETISLEFKLSDWQSALKQGFRYKKLSTSSYVIMPAEKTTLLKKNRSRFANLDVGVVAYSHLTKKAEVITKPSKSSPSNSSFFGCLSRISEFAELQVA